jgi:predicted DNA-binding transcriptional regulator YafY
LRDDFRAFRIDRIAGMTPAGRTFKPERGKQLADFYRRMERAERVNGHTAMPRPNGQANAA